MEETFIIYVPSPKMTLEQCQTQMKIDILLPIVKKKHKLENCKSAYVIHVYTVLCRM